MQESVVTFASSHVQLQPDRLLGLIPGSGALKAGKWARSLIITNSLQSGSQNVLENLDILLVKKPNGNTKVEGGKITKTKSSQNAKEHTHHVWYVVPCCSETSPSPRPHAVTAHKTTIHMFVTAIKTKLRGLSPRANYTDRATAACRRS
jgi:hypothetical protein